MQSPLYKSLTECLILSGTISQQELDSEIEKNPKPFLQALSVYETQGLVAAFDHYWAYLVYRDYEWENL